MKPIFKAGDIITHNNEKHPDIYRVLDVVHKDGFFGKITRKYLYYKIRLVRYEKDTDNYLDQTFIDVFGHDGNFEDRRLLIDEQEKFILLRRDGQSKIKKKKLKI